MMPRTMAASGGPAAAVGAAPRAAVTTADELARLTAAVGATAERYDRSGELPREGLEAAHRAGVFHAVIGERFGGAQIGAVERLRMVQALGEGDASVALLVANAIGVHVAQAEADVWPPDRYRELLDALARRPVLVNAARAEPDLGAPARGGLPETTIRRSADGWVLTGRKAYVTGSEGLDYHLVWAKTDDPVPRIGHVIVPGTSDGIEVVRTWDHLGLRASATHDVVYSDVVVRETDFLEIPYDGRYRDPAGAGGPLALAHMALYVGVARAAQRFFVRFAHERVPSALGRAIATTERIQQIAGEIEAQLVQAEELLYGLTARAERGDAEAARRTRIAKPLIVRAVVAAVETAVAALGNPALTRHHPLERHLRDVLSARVHPPQEDTALLATGREVLGIA